MAKIKSLFRGAKTAADRASRRVGAAGGKAKREGDDVYSVADPAAPGGRRRARGAAGAAKSGKTDEVKELTTRGRKRIAGGAAAVGAGVALTQGGAEDKKANDKKKEKDYTKGVSRGGVPFDEAFAKARKDGKKTFEWNGKKYTTELASEKKSSSKPSSSSSSSSSTKEKRGILFGKDAKFRPFGGVLARALLGEDEKFGGDRGAIDFIRPKKKNMGGMMKKKGYSKGGSAASALPPSGKKSGGMMAKKGYAKGGAVRKKARGVGAATRGFGKAMR